jgi:hypothetical protein
MPLDARTIWRVFWTKGYRVALSAVVGGIFFGVADQFGARIIPGLASRLENSWDPPRYMLAFTVPVELDPTTTIQTIEPAASNSAKIEKADRDHIFVLGAPGHYRLTLRRRRNQIMEEIGTIVTLDNRGQRVSVDTSASKWANAASARTSIEPSAAPEAALQRPALLRETRWTAAEPDFAAITSAPDPTTRAMLALALSQVGVFEYGSEFEKDRIFSYWVATGSFFIEQNQITRSNLGPWGGAFLAWLAQKSDLRPPPSSPAFTSWTQWGERVPDDSAMPGMLGIFRIAVPEAPSRLLVGVILRKNRDCIDIVAGNVADRVVITCVAAPVEGIRRPPSLALPESVRRP